MVDQFNQLCFSNPMKQSEFETEKGSSLSHQLIKAGRLINEQGLATARELYQLPALKQSHLDLMPYIDFEGTSVSEIAKRKGVSKQSVSKLVQEMVSMEMLYINPDPEDSRSKLVFFQTTGPLSIQKGFAALTSIDQVLMEHLGEKSYKTVLKKISGIVECMAADN